MAAVFPLFCFGVVVLYVLFWGGGFILTMVFHSLPWVEAEQTFTGFEFSQKHFKLFWVKQNAFIYARGFFCFFWVKLMLLSWNDFMIGPFQHILSQLFHESKPFNNIQKLTSIWALRLITSVYVVDPIMGALQLEWIFNKIVPSCAMSWLDFSLVDPLLEH